MNRRDTIIVAVLLNAAIIAVLLIMAVNTDEEVLYERPRSNADKIAANQSAATNEQTSESLLPQAPSNGLIVDLDDVNFEHDYPASPDEFFLVEEDLGLMPEQPLKSRLAEDKPISQEMDGVKIVEIIVKKGDSLDKIARGNGTTIEAIKNLNQLKSINLSIGQKLNVPVGYKKSNATSAPIAKENKPAAAAKPAVKPQTGSAGELYVIKSGDSPWKIAREQHVSMDDILRLNQLTEEKARNLKVGDKIRIR